MKLGRLLPTLVLCLALPVGPLSNVQAQTAQTQTTQQPPPPPASTSTSTQTQTAQTQTTQQPPPPPDNLTRIREGLTRPGVLKTDGQPRIYVNIFGKWPTFAEMTKGYDLMNGPTSTTNNAMSHQEFLGMVTPKEMVGSGGVSAGEVLTMAAVNYVGQLLVSKGIKAVAKGRSEKKLTAIQAQIDRELAALRGGR